MVLALIAGGALAACSSEDTQSSGPQSSPGQTVSAPASGDAFPSDSPSASASGPQDTPGAAPQPCATDQLTAALGQGGGGAAGHSLPTIDLTNASDTTCTLTGYPGVSFVGDDNGTQLGAAATRDGSGPAATTVTLDPGAAASAQLDITRAENYSEADCAPQPADGLRIYPPDQDEALFVATDGYTACANDQIVLISVRPLEPAA